MEAVVKPEPVWLLEDQAVLDDLKKEVEAITSPDVNNEFLKTDIQSLRHSVFQNDAGIKEESSISDGGNEEIKSEIDVEEHSILEDSSKFHLCVEMNAAVNPEPVWLLEDQAVLDGMKREGEPFRDVKDEFLKTDMQVLRHNIFQNEAGIKEEASISNGRNEDMKSEMDDEEHSVLEESSEYIPSNISCNTGVEKSGYISISTNKPDHILTKNVKIHIGGKPFECDVCDKSFSHYISLTKHVRTHTGDKPFKCEVCSKCFTRRGSLTDHLRTHTGDKPFKCETCGKKFVMRSTLTNHIRTHTGDKPFKCEVCSKCCTRRGGLENHMRTHTGDKPFKCKLCNKCFRESGHLRKHMKTHTIDNAFK